MNVVGAGVCAAAIVGTEGAATPVCLGTLATSFGVNTEVNVEKAGGLNSNFLEREAVTTALTAAGFGGGKILGLGAEGALGLAPGVSSETAALGGDLAELLPGLACTIAPICRGLGDTIAGPSGTASGRPGK